MKKELAKISRLLKNAKTAIIASHVDPDGDSIGSTLALGAALEKIGLTVTLYCADQVPQIYRFLYGSEKIKRTLPLQPRYHLAFMLDSSDLCRVGEKIDLRSLAPTLINIDHHPDNTKFGDVNYVKGTASVAEVVFELLRYLKVKIDRPIANCLYAAMITDTGNFCYSNTTVKTFLIAAELLKAGVKPHEIATRIYETRTISSIKIAARALSELKFSADHKAAWTSVSEKMMAETGAKGEDLVGIVDRIRAIDGVEAAVFFREDNGKIKINFRSKDKANVSEIARRFGGGGHVRAAGAAVDGGLEETASRVMAEVQKHLKAISFPV